MATHPRRWILGVSGASGMRYMLRLLDVMTRSDIETHVVISEAAFRVLREEESIKASPGRISAGDLLGEERSGVIFHDARDIAAACASGSFRFEGMVICPSSMATVGAIARGVPQNLLHRSAEVAMKEGRKLVIVPRETPLSAIHLENLLTLARLGVSIVPAMPGFYHKPSSVEQLVDMLVMKVLDQMGVENDLVTRWRQG